MPEEFEFEEMSKKQSKLSVEIFGPSGSGKTSALIKLAMGIRDKLYPGKLLKDICLFVDTEKGSANKAVGRSVGGETLESMLYYMFKPPYDIVKLMNLIDYALSKGIKIMIIDSYTAFWSGQNGILDRAAEIEVELGDKKKMYGAWSEKEIVAKKNILKNIIANDSMHMLLGMRAKTEYAMELNSRGKTVPKAVGLKEDMQGDVRYETDVVLSLDLETHECKVVKDRIGYNEIKMVQENPEAPITVADGALLAQIVSEGISPEEVQKRKIEGMIKFILNEKSHKSSKVTELEGALKQELTPALLAKLPLEKLVKFTEYIKG